MSFKKIRETIEAITGSFHHESDFPVQNPPQVAGQFSGVTTTATQNVLAIEPAITLSNVSIITDQTQQAAHA